MQSFSELSVDRPSIASPLSAIKTWSRKVAKPANHGSRLRNNTAAARHLSHTLDLSILRDARTDFMLEEPLESLHEFWKSKTMASFLP